MTGAARFTIGRESWTRTSNAIRTGFTVRRGTITLYFPVYWLVFPLSANDNVSSDFSVVRQRSGLYILHHIRIVGASRTDRVTPISMCADLYPSAPEGCHAVLPPAWMAVGERCGLRESNPRHGWRKTVFYHLNQSRICRIIPAIYIFLLNNHGADNRRFP